MTNEELHQMDTTRDLMRVPKMSLILINAWKYKAHSSLPEPKSSARLNVPVVHTGNTTKDSPYANPIPWKRSPRSCLSTKSVTHDPLELPFIFGAVPPNSTLSEVRHTPDDTANSTGMSVNDTGFQPGVFVADDHVYRCRHKKLRRRR